MPQTHITYKNFFIKYLHYTVQNKPKKIMRFIGKLELYNCDNIGT